MENEIKYRQNKITDLLVSLRSDFFDLALLWENEELNHEYLNNLNHLEKKEYIEDSFKEKSWALYKICMVYFESLQLPQYLNDFKREMFIQLNENLYEIKYSDEDTLPFSITISKFWYYLSPFEFSQENYLDRLLKNSGILYLENILRNTQTIIDKTDKKPTTEPKLYNVVKFVIESIFPSSQEPSSGFFKCFKNYKPDILIPELHVAIEYKYASSENELKTQIDQIVADTKGYTGDINYEIFYAVFYVTQDFFGLPRFEQAIKEMDLPKNWKCIYIIGKNYK